MAYRQVGATATIASWAPSAYVALPIVTGVLGAKRIMVLVYGGSGGGCRVDQVQFKGIIDGASITDNGMRTFTLAPTPVNPVGLTRGQAIACVWTPGIVAPGSIGGWSEYPFPGFVVYMHSDATAGTATNVQVEVWVDDSMVAGVGQSQPVLF